MKQSYQELMKKDTKSLIAENREILQKLMSLRFQLSGRNLEKTSEILKLRRARARVQTALTKQRSVGGKK